MTKIYSANITIGKDHENPITIKQVPIKRLPLKQLANDSFFVGNLISAVGGTRWTDFAMNKETRMPHIKIEWLKYLSDVANELELESHE